jgi:hypothetical protein
MRNWLSRLTNPFVLVVEGFLVGAVLFVSSAPGRVHPHPTPPAALDPSVIPNSSR